MERDPTFETRLGAQVRKLRRQAGRSQEVFAEMASISPRFLGSIERGQVQMSVGTCRLIAGALGLKMWQFWALLDE